MIVVGKVSDVFLAYIKMFVELALHCVTRVATNLEYSGISLNMENSGNSVQPRGKIVTNKVFLVCHSNICVKLLLTG